MTQNLAEANYQKIKLYYAKADAVYEDKIISICTLPGLISMKEAGFIELSLDGVRKTTRYQEIEVEYYDFNWKKQRQKLSGWTAQICQHEIDHLSGKII